MARQKIANVRKPQAAKRPSPGADQRCVIANTTPLINFAEIERMDLLQNLFGQITAPTVVLDELQTKSKRFVRAAAIRQHAFVQIREQTNRVLVDTLRHELHAGEAECVALAWESPTSLLILDDVTARTVTQQHGLPVMGTIGCLLLAKRRRLIAQIGPLLVALRDKARFWLSARLIERVLEDAHERAPESL